MRQSPEPVRNERGWWLCPHQGCHDKRTPGGEAVARRHAQEAHYLCECGRWLTHASMAAHRRAIERYGIKHPPFPSFTPMNPTSHYSEPSHPPDSAVDRVNPEHTGEM